MAALFVVPEWWGSSFPAVHLPLLHHQAGTHSPHHSPAINARCNITVLFPSEIVYQDGKEAI